MIAPALVVAAALAAPFELKLPPSAQWREEKDPTPMPSAAAKSRYFVRVDEPSVELRVITDPALRLDYSPAVLKEIAGRVIAAQAKHGVQLKISDPKLLEVGGVNVGSLQVQDPGRVSTMFYLPAEDGDRVVTFIVPMDRDGDLAEIVRMVEGATGLRRPDTFSSSGPYVMGGMAAVSLGTIGVVLFLMSRRRAG
jgi:hypothetical protein